MKVEEIHLALKKNQEVKVEFALIDDINALKIKANNSEDKSIKGIQSALSTLSKSKLDLDLAIKDSLSVLEGIDKAKVLAKELGVELPTNINSSYKYYQDSATSFKRLQNEISKFDSIINSID